MESLQAGVECAIPISAMALLTGSEIEVRAVGDPTVDIDIMKSITSYPYCQKDSAIVGIFWNVFEAFTDEERQAYLKFVWGRSRLPIDVSNLEYKHELRLMENMDPTGFPQAHTCFFQLDIPNYPNEEVCRAKLLTAILFCGEIDTDHGANDVRAETDSGEE